MKTNLLILLIGIAFVGCVELHAQGKWEKVFLTEYLAPTDSVDAHFIAYEYILDGYKNYVPSEYSVPRLRLTVSRDVKISYSNDLPKKGSPTLLNDTICIFRDGVKRSELVYSKGFIKKASLFHYKKGKFKGWDIFDFTKQFENQEGSFLVRSEKIDRYYRFKAYKGWDMTFGKRRKK